MKYTIIVAIPLLLLIGPLIAYNTDEWIEITVNEKERVTQSTAEGVDSKYLIYTDEEVLENTDSVWYWKFNSSDYYGSLKEGETYKARVYGFRIPFLSWYRNIIELEAINHD